MSLSTQIKVLGGLPTAGSPPAASSLSVDEIAAALDAGSGTASQVVRGDGTISALAVADLPFTGTANNNHFARGDGAWTNGVSSGGWTAGFFGGASSATAVVVRNYTNDASDTLSAQITGGGASLASAGSSQTRGAGFIAHGNESGGNTGNAYVLLGAISGAKFSIYNDSAVEAFAFTGGELRIPAANTVAGSSSERNIGPVSGSSVSNRYNSGSGGIHVFASGGSTVGIFDTVGVQANRLYPISDVGLDIYLRSSDGADNKAITLAGGGAIIAPGSSQTRGAAIEIAGNEHATRPGILSLMAGATGYLQLMDSNAVARVYVDGSGLTANSTAGSGRVSVGTSFTTVRSLAGAQAIIFATVTGKGTILLEWDGTTLTKLAGAASLVVAGSAGAGETAFRASGGNLQAIVDTGTRDVSAGFSIRH